MSDKEYESLSVSVAVIDDDEAICRWVAAELRKIKCDVRMYNDGNECIKVQSVKPVDIVITDLYMPTVDGLAVLMKIKELSPDTEVIIMTGQADKHVAIQALKAGAFDFFEKPVDRVELVETIKKTMRYRAALRERDEFAGQLSFLSQREAEKWGIDAFVGKSKAIASVIKNIRSLQLASNTSVLITGESGTGKELVARSIHFGGVRSTRPFVPINCSAVPQELAESMLFGHTRGAFTGAITDKKGCFDHANGGTLFMDEIGDMPAPMQAKLLRILEDGMVVPVGASVGHKVNVRVVAATNAHLDEKIKAGLFRADLFFRLSSFTVHIPSLKEHKDDVKLLVEHFVRVLSSEMGFPAPVTGAGVIELLEAYDFPGNVRQLKNMIERALIESAGKEIMPDHFLIPAQTVRPAAISQSSSAADNPLNLGDSETALIRKAMENVKGNVSAAAKVLGINRTKLYRKLAQMSKQ